MVNGANKVCKPRSPEAVAEAVGIIDPEHNVELLPHDVDGDRYPETFCNFFARQVCALLEAPIIEARANDQIQWLRDPDGHGHQWRKVTPDGAMALAGRGQPVLVGWWNPNSRTDKLGQPMLDEHGKPLHRPGHIALVRKTPDGEHGVWISQCGAHNYALAKLIQGFGQLAPLEFFAHE